MYNSELNSKLRALAIYLPQFHPVKENDEWWGMGFTEWTNVAKSTARFPGHYQPQLPTDLGFYDLRVAEVRQLQADLAKQYGIHGFCYYHYWFTGRRILEQPFNAVLQSGKPDFPFCLCWANENWTRRWDGQDQEVLLKQDYSEEDDRAHIRSLIPAFTDDRYIRVDGKPVFIVYRTNLLPDPKHTAKIWREEVQQAGISGLYLIQVNSLGAHHNPNDIGFDAALDFQPDWGNMPAKQLGGIKEKFMRRLGNKPHYDKDNIYDYDAMVDKMIARKGVGYKMFPGVTPSWDNSARRKQGATIVDAATPDKYEEWLRNIVNTFKPYSKEENFIFINAWNEWAEGNHLEPCIRWGRKYLEATARALSAINNH
ncbi:glycosyl hydrolase [Hymenobacter sp. RP-2-7]|uniref:Glycosyl hydrolase n=1 Tax=Hymenobacter polaris TaxID=2682546 RepID=A0A7Y0AIM0_9BACT|nr:glycoside hydrolase family 99-like domain-containing protein [Hymenobacter polaris]NML68059.1 glycosyl hydrolase [Hymenobacter polaris]